MLDWQTKRALQNVISTNYLGETVINVQDIERIFEKVLDELNDDEKVDRKSKFRLFNDFVMYILNRNRANFDSMLLLTGDKGTGKSSFAIMFARMWCKIIDIKFNPNKHICYSNAQVMKAIEELPPFHPVICDEAIDFASAQNWNKRENKDLKIKLGKVRTKHLLFILCWPWKINRLDKIYFESYINYWIDLYGRGKGALFVKDKNPYNNPWKIDEFKDIGSFTEFTKESDVQKIYSKHPNFWSLIYCQKPSAHFYSKYLKVREANVYNDKNVMESVDTNDIYRAFLIKTLEDAYMKGSSKAYKRLQKHLEERYHFQAKEPILKGIFDDSNKLVEKIMEDQGTEAEKVE